MTCKLKRWRSTQKKSKTIVFQPFGRGAKVDKEKQEVFDEDSRSFSSADYLFLTKKLAQKYNVPLTAASQTGGATQGAIENF